MCPLESDGKRTALEKSEETTQVSRKLEERKGVVRSYSIYENIPQLKSFDDHSSWGRERTREVKRTEGTENFLEPRLYSHLVLRLQERKGQVRTR